MTFQSLVDLVSGPDQVIIGGRRIVRSREDLRHVLQKERARTDRSGRPLHWVIFRLDDAQHAPRLLKDLGDIIAARARHADEVGWFEETAVCAILPETDQAGVQCFVNGVRQLAHEQGLTPSHVVCAYPLASISSGDSTRRRSRRLTPGNRSVRTPQGHVARDGSVDANRDNPQPPEAVATEERFVRRLPWWKRAVDIVGATIGILLSSPILLAAAAAVKMSSAGPILFVQRRAGLGGRPFSIYKFRSMRVNAEGLKARIRHLSEQDGPAFKIKNDPRVTSVGRLLRSTSIDELPQLFNVLKGDMSLVGPRPSTFDEIAMYRAWYRRRFDVTPGITCIWQVRGRARVSFENWMRMDIQYIRNYGFWQDITLLLATIPAVLLRRGAH
jgi:lipopolysaccharide/colanic/teichoic acid biosynthesis glycosyltransferase